MRKGPHRPVISVISAVMISLISPHSYASETLIIQDITPVVGSVSTVSNIWKGDIPTKVAYPAGSFSQTLEFPIQGLLPYSSLANRATGVKVEFEMWSQAGKRVAYDTVYSFDWNPVGPNTLVSMRLSQSDSIGTHTMLIRTIYELSTTGLLTRYQQSEVKFPIQIVAFSKPGSSKTGNASWQGDSLKYVFSRPDPATDIIQFEVGIAHLLNPSSPKDSYANYSDYTVLKSVPTTEFILRADEICEYAKSKPVDFTKSSVMVRQRAVNSFGNGDWGYAFYHNLTSFNCNKQSDITIPREKVASQQPTLNVKKTSKGISLSGLSFYGGGDLIIWTKSVGSLSWKSQKSRIPVSSAGRYQKTLPVTNMKLPMVIRVQQSGSKNFSNQSLVKK